MKKKNYIIIVWALAAMNVQADTLQLDLAATIAMAQRQSPSVQSARNTFLSAYWAYRYHQANYLPSLSLSSSPYKGGEQDNPVGWYGSLSEARSVECRPYSENQPEYLPDGW